MTKRHAWWVIVMGEAATAFRAREREELLPTLKQLQHTQPEAALKWFERGRLWTSPEEAQAAAREARRARGAGRSRDWRPGGAHVDPRAKYKLTRDQKRARWKQREGWRRERDDEGSRGGTFDARGPRDPRGQHGHGRPPLDWKPPSAKRDEPSGDRRPPLEWKPPSPKRNDRSSADRRPPVDWKPAPGPKGARPAYGKPGPKAGGRWSGKPGGKGQRPWSGHGKPAAKGRGPWSGHGKPGPKSRGTWSGGGKPGDRNRGESSGGWKPRPQAKNGRSDWKPSGGGWRPREPRGETPRLEWKPPKRKRGDDDTPSNASSRSDRARPFRPRGGKGPRGRS
ncbi:MAG TPA: hypothetical protein VG538_03275 [Vicinamibacterales bacterium]|nr:hypothetical protein [Vicinamibacterales bacterium]